MTAIQLPSIQTLPFSMIMAGGCGLLYGKIFQTNSYLAAKAFALTVLADSLLYYSINGLLGDGTRIRREIIYTCTSLTVNLASAVALRQLELLGTRGAIFLSAMNALAFAGRVRHFS